MRNDGATGEFEFRPCTSAVNFELITPGHKEFLQPLLEILNNDYREYTKKQNRLGELL